MNHFNPDRIDNKWQRVFLPIALCALFLSFLLPLSKTVTKTAQIMPLDYEIVYARAKGRLLHHDIKDGEHVVKGQVLGEIEYLLPSADFIQQEERYRRAKLIESRLQQGQLSLSDYESLQLDLEREFGKQRDRKEQPSNLLIAPADGQVWFYKLFNNGALVDYMEPILIINKQHGQYQAEFFVDNEVRPYIDKDSKVVLILKGKQVQRIRMEIKHVSQTKSDKGFQVIAVPLSKVEIPIALETEVDLVVYRKTVFDIFVTEFLSKMKD